jgi:hypothetical protein
MAGASSSESGRVRDGRRLGTRERSLRVHRAVGAAIHRRSGGQRRALAAVEKDVLTRVIIQRSAVQQKETAAAQPRPEWFYNRQRRGHGHRRIEGIAAAGKHRCAGLSGQRMRTGAAAFEGRVGIGPGRLRHRRCQRGQCRHDEAHTELGALHGVAPVSR